VSILTAPHPTQPEVAVLQIAFSNGRMPVMVKQSVLLPLSPHTRALASHSQGADDPEAISPTASPYQCAISI